MVNANRDAYVQPGEVTYGVAGYNEEAHNVCYIGGMEPDNSAPKDTRTEAQRKALETIVQDYLEFAPTVEVAGHNQFAAKACPSFDVPAWLRELGIPEKNIYKG
jgi:hypothetical protein